MHWISHPSTADEKVAILDRKWYWSDLLAMLKIKLSFI